MLRALLCSSVFINGCLSCFGWSSKYHDYSGEHYNMKKDSRIPVSPNVWRPSPDVTESFKAWLKNYMADEHRKEKEREKANYPVPIHGGRPYSWQGYGPGSGGVDPPPWAVFEGGYGKPDYCFLDPARGHCSEHLMRWGYNPFTKECTQFEYSGCGGNNNNFATKSRCEVACAIDAATNCQLFNS